MSRGVKQRHKLKIDAWHTRHKRQTTRKRSHPASEHANTTPGSDNDSSDVNQRPHPARSSLGQVTNHHVSTPWRLPTPSAALRSTSTCGQVACLTGAAPRNFNTDRVWVMGVVAAARHTELARQLAAANACESEPFGTFLLLTH